MLFSNINITNDTDQFQYVVEYIKNDSLTIDKASYVDGLSIDNNISVDDVLFFYDTQYEQQINHKGHWYKLMLNKLPVENLAYIPRNCRAGYIRVYFPDFSIDSYMHGCKYALTAGTWICGKYVVLGAYIFNRIDANACEGVKTFFNERYYECIDLPIIDPTELIYSDDWRSWREGVCGESIDKNLVNSVGSVLYCTLHPVMEFDEEYIKMDGYTGGQTSIGLTEYDNDYLNLNINSNTIRSLRRNERPSIECKLNYNNFYTNFYDYLKETYSDSRTLWGIMYEMVIGDSNNIYIQTKSPKINIREIIEGTNFSIATGEEKATHLYDGDTQSYRKAIHETPMYKFVETATHIWDETLKRYREVADGETATHIWNETLKEYRELQKSFVYDTTISAFKSVGGGEEATHIWSNPNVGETATHIWDEASQGYRLPIQETATHIIQEGVETATHIWDEILKEYREVKEGETATHIWDAELKNYRYVISLVKDGNVYRSPKQYDSFYIFSEATGEDAIYIKDGDVYREAIYEIPEWIFSEATGEDAIYIKDGDVYREAKEGETATHKITYIGEHSEWIEFTYEEVEPGSDGADYDYVEYEDGTSEYVWVGEGKGRYKLVETKYEVNGEYLYDSDIDGYRKPITQEKGTHKIILGNQYTSDSYIYNEEKGWYEKPTIETPEYSAIQKDSNSNYIYDNIENYYREVIVETPTVVIIKSDNNPTLVYDSELRIYRQPKRAEDLATHMLLTSVISGEYVYDNLLNAYRLPIQEDAVYVLLSDLEKHPEQYAFTKDEIGICDAVWQEGLSIKCSFNLYKNDEPFISAVSNSLPLTQKLFSYLASTDFKDTYNYTVNNVNLDSVNMNILNINAVNKTINEITKIERPAENLGAIAQTFFYRVTDSQAIVVRPAVNENICINLDSYKHLVKSFVIQIEGVKFVEIGRNKSGVVFKIIGNKLPKQASSGQYYILNQDSDLVTSGKYIYEV